MDVRAFDPTSQTGQFCGQSSVCVCVCVCIYVYVYVYVHVKL